MQIERREHERIETRFPVRLWLLEDYQGREIEFEGFATIWELAIGGAYIRADYLLPIGFPLNLEITLEDDEVLSCRCEIVHTIPEQEIREPGMGVMFTYLDAENRERLLRCFVSDRIREFYLERFLQEFPHLESKFSLSEITLIVNLWEDKDDRLGTMREGASEKALDVRRKEEVQATRNRLRGKSAG